MISIGALAANAIWNEKAPVRAGHSTSVLIRADAPSGRPGDPPRVILVDPGLPPDALAARLAERANCTPEQVTHVFLTSFRPELRRGITLFERATWWIGEREREAVGVPLAAAAKRAMEAQDREAAGAIQQELAILQRCQPAPDHLADRVDLFPLPGVTPGLTGLIISGLRHTTLITGDAIPTADHLAEGKLFNPTVDVEQARASFEEAVEIADLIIPGRDNWFVNQTKKAF
ncbi:MAG: hypothetical protein EA378_03720 [Phycisphaerales bacterium]|nr:MAG: hypothetical protein EA378_03720 [Phycisphaerales bacterium]